MALFAWRGHSCPRLWSCLPTRSWWSRACPCGADTPVCGFEVACRLGSWVEHGLPVWRGHSCPRLLKLLADSVFGWSMARLCGADTPVRGLWLCFALGQHTEGQDFSRAVRVIPLSSWAEQDDSLANRPTKSKDPYCPTSAGHLMRVARHSCPGFSV